MKIVNKNKLFHGKVMNLPDIGAVTIGADGEIDIDEKVATLLVTSGGDDWIDPNAKVTTKQEEAALAGEIAPKETGMLENVPDAQTTEMLAALDTMSVDEMLAVAEASGIKNYHLFKKKPEVLRNYIKNKLNGK